MAEPIVDKRFAHIARDPKFKRIPKNERKIKIDKRFQSMFNDKKFAIKYTVDKRGKPINQTSMENLQKYYEQSSSEDESDTETSTNTKKDRKKGISKHNNRIVHDETEDASRKEKNDSDGSISIRNNPIVTKSKEEGDENLCTASSSCTIDLDEDLKENHKQLYIKDKDEHLKLTNEIKEKLQDLSVNYARGEGTLLTDSSSDEETSEYSDESEDIEHGWGELDKDAETTDEITRKLAVCNMNWDRIRAVDLMVLFHSFLPSGGIIHSVTIYPSEFGLERMKEEEIKGPVELVNDKKEEDHSENDNEEGSNYHMEKLRRYQLNRLKYYYAVLECDSAETANKIYTDCDGIEYESTATRLDLRFIPDDMNFDQEPREVCTELPEISKYQPRQFITTALQQAKVQLTWDETNPEREELANRLNSGKINEINEKDLQAYLANGTSDDDTDKEIEQDDRHQREIQEDLNTPNDPIEKYKSLLKQLDEDEEAKKNKDVELEFTWGIGTEEKTEKLVNEKLNKNKHLAPFEKYLAKRKTKQKARKEEIKKLIELHDDNISNSDDSDVNFSKNNKPINSRLSCKKQQIAGENGDVDSSSMEDEKTKHVDELELLLMDETENENKKHFDMNKIEANTNLSKSKLKRLKKKQNVQKIEEDQFQVNVNDPRFASLFTSHNFNIDPADPHYRKTKGTETLIQEKLKRRAEHTPVDVKEEKMSENNKKLKLELQALVKSVKRNTKTISQSLKR
ncbi:hypothetical protein M0804_004354 [Polistes exclamans]|nr:hypothetical protein M0804_004354 [Polistes exclamans]